MARTTGKKKELRVMAPPFTVAAPSGARIRDRLRVSDADAGVLAEVGTVLGSLYRRDLRVRTALGIVPAKENKRAARKRGLTASTSSRWAGSITRTSEDQFQLALCALRADVTSLEQAVRTITRRLQAPAGGRLHGIKGYPTQRERNEKQRRLQVLTARLHAAHNRLREGRPAIVPGGRRLLHARHHLAAAELTEPQWRDRWNTERLFLTADGESGAPFGNYTITVDPADGSVVLVLPETLRHLANAPRGRYRLACTVTFNHRADQWRDRAAANKAVRYDIRHDADRDRWYLDTSWSAPTAEQPTPEQFAGQRLLGVDLNADHLAAYVIDGHGNPIGAAHTIPFDLTGPAGQRDGHLRAAITELINLAKVSDCAGIAIENLGFADARATGRETMGRGRRGKRFRRTVAGIPTAKFRDRLAGMAHHAGLAVIAVDPAYTSRWGGQHWLAPLRQNHPATTRHHAASLVIARRAHGHTARRRTGVTAHDQRIVARRAAVQAGPSPAGTGRIPDPSRTPRTPSGDKTRQRPDGTPGPPSSKTVREEPRQLCLEWVESTNNGQLS